jgi:hypothetical protein
MPFFNKHSDEKRSDGEMPVVESGEKHLAQDLPINTDSESATVMDDTSEYMAMAKHEGINPAFMAKVTVLNKAMNELGMGRYQWELFFTSGFGWMADNICKCPLLSLSIIADIQGSRPFRSSCLLLVTNGGDTPPSEWLLSPFTVV